MHSTHLPNSLCTVVAVLLAGSILPIAAHGQQAGGPTLYQFQPGQMMRFNVSLMDDGELSEGFYQVSVAPAGGGQVQLSIEAQVGDNSCNTSSAVAPGAAVAGQMMMTCFTLIPIAAALYAPTWAMFMGQSFAVGNSWSMGNVSFEVTENCSYAGVTGVRMVMSEDDEVKIETCYSNSFPLPLYVKFRTDENSYVEMAATKVQGG